MFAIAFSNNGFENSPNNRAVLKGYSYGLSRALARPNLFEYSTEIYCGVSHENNGQDFINRSGQKKTVFAWGRIDNRTDVSENFGIPKNGTLQAFIYNCHQIIGDEFLNHLVGDFTFAIVDHTSKRLVFGRDEYGTRPFFYTLKNGTIYLSNTPVALLGVKQLNFTKNKEWIARSLGLSMQVAREPCTAYIEITRVPYGQTLSFAGDEVNCISNPKTISVKPIWETTRSETWVTKYRDQFKRATLARVGNNTIAVESSAGLDSSSILVTISENSTQDIFCYSGIEGSQSEKLVQSLSEQCSVLDTYFTEKAHPNDLDNPKFDSDEAISRFELNTLGYPMLHGSYVPLDRLEQAAVNHGLSTIFSGFGGDEISSNYGWLFLSECVERGEYNLLFKSFQGNAIKRFLKVLKFILQKNFGEEIKNESHAIPVFKKGIKEKYKLDFVEQNQVKKERQLRSINDWILGVELHSENMASRFECHSLTGAAFDISYVWPFWDARLIETYLKTPSVEKWGPKGVSRFLHRRAMDKMVPDEINWRRSKKLGDDLDTGANQDQAIDSLFELCKDIERNLHPILDEMIDLTHLKKTLLVSHNDSSIFAESAMLLHTLYQMNFWCHNGE